MEPLLRITSIPIAYELKVTNAKLEYSNDKAEVNITRTDGGGFKLKNNPTKLRMDTFEARNSVCPTTIRSVEQAAQKGKQAALQATAEYAKEGAVLNRAKLGEDPLGQITAMRNQMPTGSFDLKFLPTSGPNINWTKPDLTMQYQADKLNFDLKILNGNFKYIPGNVEMLITQMPDIKIEYIGQPMYVPPSAAERFTQVDIRA